MHKFFTSILFLLFIYQSKILHATDVKSNFTKTELFILDNKKDSALFYQKLLPKNSYSLLLKKLISKKNISYNEYANFLNIVSSKTDIKYTKVSNFINQHIQEPTSKKNINSAYVHLKWLQVSKLRDYVTLEEASKVQTTLENYVAQFKTNNNDVVKAKTLILTHPIVMANISGDMEGKKMCLEALETAKKLGDIEMEIIFLYHLTDYLILERKLQEYIDVSEQGLALENKLEKKSSYYFATIHHLIDAYIFKGGNNKRVTDLLNILYDDDEIRAQSYELFAKYISKLDKDKAQLKAILQKFNVTSVDELVEVFLENSESLNQLDFEKLLGESANALLIHGFINKGMKLKNNQVALVKQIYSKDLSETLADYKLEKEKLSERLKEENQEEIQSILYGLMFVAAIFLLISFATINKIRKQSNELEIQNKLINKTLNEKDLLVKEIHHRVKNNLQMVASLIDLQSKTIKNKQAKEITIEGKSRINSMVIIHQKLYENDEAEIKIDDFLLQLLKEIESIYGLNKKVDLSINTEKIIVDVDTAIPLALIFNEILTNAYKYAFKQNESSKLHIELEKLEDEYKLIVEDFGPGLPKDFNIETSKTLGLRLISRLTKQLQGKLTIINENGLKYIITFKDVNFRKKFS